MITCKERPIAGLILNPVSFKMCKILSTKTDTCPDRTYTDINNPVTGNILFLIEGSNYIK